MKNIIYHTISVIAILIVSFFIVKYFLNRRILNKNTLVVNNNIEHFSTDTELNNLRIVFGLNNPLITQFNGYDSTIVDINSLNKYFLQTSTYIDNDNNNFNDKSLTKYLGVYNLLVAPNTDVDLNGISSSSLYIGDNSFNKSLENGFYGFTGGSTIYNKNNIASIKYQNDILSATPKKDEYFDINVIPRLKSKLVNKPYLGKFTDDKSQEEIYNFIDFGVKGRTYYNFYIKNIRYLLSSNELSDIIEAVNNSVSDITISTTLEAFLLKPLVGNVTAKSPDNLNGIFALIKNNILGQVTNKDSILFKLGEGLIDNSTATTPVSTATTPSTEGFTSGTSSVIDSLDQHTLKATMYREYVIFCMEILYCKMSQKIQENKLLANELFGIDINEDTNYENVNTLLGGLSSFTDFTTLIKNDTIGQLTNIVLSYFYQILIILLKLRMKIKKDNFLNKFNCKYMSYLFYSFNRGKTIFGDYIQNLSTFTNEEKNMLNIFFDNYEFEGLYKLFILSLKGNCNVFYEHESNLENIRNGLSLESLTQSTAKLMENLDFNIKNYFFYDEENSTKLNNQCKQIRQEDCTESKTKGMCLWQSASSSDPTKGQCSASPNVSEKCMYFTDMVACNQNSMCNWDVNNICKIKDCTDGVKCLHDNTTNSLPHCKLIMDNSGDVCYDNERVTYLSNQYDRKLDNPDSFFKRIESHLNRCENNIYNTETGSYAENAQDICNKNEQTNCNFLRKRNGTHNSSEFRTCAHDNLVKENAFYTCGDIKNEIDCDSKASSNLSCFWQDGKCYNRDAPLHWVTPGINTYGIEDMTACENFNSEFACPIDRCIWYNNKCLAKEDHPYFATFEAIEETPEEIIKIPIKKELVDCEAINNEKNDVIDASIECNSFKCKWDSGKKICSNKVGNSCSLHSTKDQCLDFNKNFDPISQTNYCRWSDNYNANICNMLDKSNCENNNDCVFEEATSKCMSKLPKTGYCTDTRMLQPCNMFDLEHCPTEVKVDNMGNKMPGTNHCKIVRNKCVNNGDVFSGEDSFNSCHYNYLNTGACDNNKCRSTIVYDTNRVSINNQKCVPRERLPCSLLSEEECKDKDIVSNNCYWDKTNGKCNPTQNFTTLTNLLTNVSDIGNNDYKKIQNITNEFDDINLITRENKKYYLKDINPIEGLVTQLETNGSVGYDQTQFIYTNSELVSKISKDDIIQIVSNTYTIEPVNQNISQYRVKSVDVHDKIIEIEPLNHINLLQINSSNNLFITNTDTSNVKWMIKNPSLGLFGSYQHSQAMIDSIKINDFYNNFF